MKRAGGILKLAAVLAASFLGGATAQWAMCAGGLVFAQDRAPWTDHRAVAANSFETLDRQDRLRAWLGVDRRDGRPGLMVHGEAEQKLVLLGEGPDHDGFLALHDGAGRSCVQLSAATGTTGRGFLVLYNREGKGIGYLGGKEHGGSFLQLSTESGDPRLEIDSGPQGLPFLRMRGPDRETQVLLGLAEYRLPIQVSGRGTSPTLVLRDRGGSPRAILGLGAEQGRPVLRFHDELQNPVLWLGTGGGRPNLTFLDRQGKVRVKLGLEEDGSPRLTMYDAEGAAVWSAP